MYDYIESVGYNISSVSYMLGYMKIDYFTKTIFINDDYSIDWLKIGIIEGVATVLLEDLIAVSVSDKWLDVKYLLMVMIMLSIFDNGWYVEVLLGKFYSMFNDVDFRRFV